MRGVLEAFSNIRMICWAISCCSGGMTGGFRRVSQTSNWHLVASLTILRKSPKNQWSMRALHRLTTVGNKLLAAAVKLFFNCAGVLFCLIVFNCLSTSRFISESSVTKWTKRAKTPSVSRRVLSVVLSCFNCLSKMRFCDLHLRLPGL